MVRQIVPPSSIYSEKLSCLYEGHALWYPEPHITGEVQIGDVGYVNDGAFFRLLNVRSGVPQINFWPTSFENPEPLPPKAFLIDTRSQPLVPGCYHSDGVEEVHFEGSGTMYVSRNLS